MAFKINGTAVGYEFRKLLNGTYNGKEWNSAKFEHVQDGSDLELSIPSRNPELLAFCRQSLSKGVVYNIPIVAVSGKDRSYVMMVGEPVYVGESE